MKKVLFFIFIFFVFYGKIYSQDAEAELRKQNIKENQDTLKWFEKLTFGGGFSLSLGSYTHVSISPIVGYRPVPFVLVGIESRYAYIKDNLNGFSSNYYGGGPFVRLIVYKGIYAQAQAEYVNYDAILYNSTTSQRIWSSAYLIGVGYRQALSEHSYSYISILWDINETATSLYTSPIIRFGFLF